VIDGQDRWRVSWLSLGILSRRKIFTVAVFDAIGGQPDMRKMRQNRANDPKLTWRHRRNGLTVAGW
jgi:hypothetical protein